VPTLHRKIPQYTTWRDSWEEFFTNSIQRVMDVEEASQGFDPEMEELCEAIVNTVCPRLLRPLRLEGGRSSHV